MPARRRVGNGEVEKSALGSGVPVYACRAGSAVSTVAVCARTGARDETERTRGATHALEHLLLRRRDDPGERSLLVEAERLGGEVNALTSKEEMIVFCRVPATHALDALELLAATVTAQGLPLEAFESERSVILEEQAGIEADPYEVAHDLVFEKAWPGDGLGHPIAGSTRDVGALEPEAVLARRDELLDARLLAVLVTGAVDLEAARERLERTRLAELPGRRGAEERSPPHCRLGRRLYARRVRGEAAQVVLAAEGFPYADPRRPAAEVLATLLGGSSASVLYRVLRDRLGLVYSIWSDHRAFTDTGLFRVEVATQRQRVAEVVRAAVDVALERLEGEWGEEEVEVARRQRAGQVVLESESSIDLAITVARNRFVGGLEGWEVARHVAALERVSAEDVHAVGRALLERGVGAIVAADTPPRTLETGFR